MKQLAFLLFTNLFSVFIYAQDAPILSNCKLDFEGNKLTLIGVDTIPGVSSDILYERALIWISETYKNPGAVIRSKDKDAGIIILNGYSFDSITKSRLELRFKDNRYRWILTDIIYDGIGTRIPPRRAEIVPRYSKLNNEQKELQLKKDAYLYITSLREAMLKQEEDW